MNTYNINDINFINSNLYKQYINENPKVGFLKIRAYTAGQAVPITGLKVTVSKIIDNNNISYITWSLIKPYKKNLIRELPRY